jgi:hypothetical protein
LAVSRKYVDDQLAIMSKYGCAPVLAEGKYDEMVYECASHAQVVRNHPRVASPSGESK